MRLVVAVLNGYSASLRKTRTSELVKRTLDRLSPGSPFLGIRSSVFWAQARRINRFADKHSSPDSALLLVGKSLGGKHMIDRVVNLRTKPWGYSKVVLMTIDPCWPTLGDWTPNLSRRVLHVTGPITRAVNYQIIPMEPRQQAGAMISAPPGVPYVNIHISGCDHFDIILHPTVKKGIAWTIAELLQVGSENSSSSAKTTFSSGVS